jgi:hypothetical protein
MAITEMVYLETCPLGIPTCLMLLGMCSEVQGTKCISAKVFNIQKFGRSVI